jgi:8-oxo-dGTP pyrophosphatase MutT (NUDIX family)
MRPRVVPWLASARALAARPPRRLRARLLLGTSEMHEVGSIEAAVAARLAAAGLPIAAHGDDWAIAPPFDASLAALARWLHGEGLAGAWRDELLPVVDRNGRTLAAVERGAVRVLGLATFAVHLSGRSAEGGFWVQQRAFDKATDPGRWDTLMGGQMGAGESVLSTLARETAEEAGLSLDQLRSLQRADDVIVRRPVDEGFMNERIAVFRATLAAGTSPVNRDGEVARFECLGETALRERLAAGEFTLEATLILGAELASLALTRRPARRRSAAPTTRPRAPRSSRRGRRRA